MDWKGLGYIISIISVLLIGVVAWPKPDEPQWHSHLLIAGMATSIIGMGLRYMAHRKELRKLKAVEVKNA